MGGLLYKDFIAVSRIKKVNLVWLLTAATCLYIVLRMIFTGYYGGKELVGVNEAGKEISILDGIFVSCLAIFSIAFASFINKCTMLIVESDEKNKIKAYFNVMPLERNTYTASKYIFIGIACYVYVSVSYIWGIACMAYCRPGEMYELCQVVLSFINVLCFMTLLFAAIELPLFMIFGKEKAMYMIAGILLAICLAVLGYLLFGDLEWINENANVFNLIDWFNKNQPALFAFQTFFSVIIITLYYLSYKLTSIVMVRRERA